jgi:prolyl 4-hydroxylase
MTAPIASRHLDLAARHDQQGDHDEAINDLSRGTQAGDPHCARLLGLRLFTGDRAPLLPEHALGFLGEACAAGLPEAAARAAGLLALGLHTPANWPLALQWLARSAHAGWEPARRQLQALCDDRALAASATSTPAYWQALAAAIDLDSWRSSPPVVNKSDDPRVAAVPQLLRPEICQVLIDLVDRDRLMRAQVYDPIAQRNIVAAHRDNTLVTYDIHEVELLHLLVQSRMAAACGFPERHMEMPNLLHYWPGEQIRNHYDFVDPSSTPDYAGEIARNGQRMVTFLIYLNADYEGGTTDFPQLGISHKGTRGEGLFFINALADLSPDLRMLHAGCPPTQGEKWVFTQFVRSRPTR